MNLLLYFLVISCLSFVLADVCAFQNIEIFNLYYNIDIFCISCVQYFYFRISLSAFILAIS